MGLEEPKISVHHFQAALAEFARTQITGAQAQALIEQSSGAPLSASEATEAQALLATITGNATAKLARAKEIDDVLLLAEGTLVPYNTPQAVATRLGV
jgi:hypothetical protein